MKLFTLAEAEALLPLLRDELLALREQKSQLDALRDELARVVRRARGNGHVTDEPAVAAKRRQAESLVERLNAGLARFNEWGIEVKGIDEGLVDFPHERDGRVVYLCWRLGEESIAWWHDLESGFAGRQPL